MKISLRQKMTAAALIALSGISLVALPAQAQPATSPKADGLSSATAAASCYEIKQNDPASKSGSYWLYTPQMSAPAQFYCDQETNGGGWVMIGRGREGWTDTYEGKGNEADIAANPDGTDAFSPVQLKSTTVDALLNGQAPSALDDGVRFYRATDKAGTKWQNSYAHRDQIQNWSWALSSWANWSNISFDNGPTSPWSKTYPGTMDRIAQYSSTVNTILFAGKAAQNWNLGFAFGPSVYGENNATSYIWGATPTAGNAIPFTQVFLRPKLTQSDLKFADIADSGTPANTQRALPNSYSDKMRWRTSNETGTGVVGEHNTLVQAFGQVGNTVFVGGDFKNLVSADGEVVNQQFLAGFDVNTGELVRGFTPIFNGQIKNVIGLPNGKLAVGGEFTEVNGKPAAGLVLLDPATGVTDTSWNIGLENRNTGGVVAVNTLDVQGNYLYVGGTFTHARGNTSSVAAYSKNATRFRLDNGGVDWKWRPLFNGTVNGINASADGKQVFAAGYFSTVGTESAFRLASLNTVDAKLTAQWNWKPSFDEARTPEWSYQFDVQDVGGSVWTGGTEHLISQYTKDNFTRLSSSITKDGGDFQDLSYHNGVVFAGCHCGDGMYQDADSWKNAWNQATNVQQIRLMGAWDAETGKYLPQFNPQLKGFHGNGVWESFTDSNGVLWAGGDIATSLGAYGVQNTVGFARFAPRDSAAPMVPTNLQVSVDNATDKLSWTKSAESGVVYQIIRDNRVVGSTSESTFSLNHQDGARYFVRAMDSAGNISASTPVVLSPVTPSTPATPTPEIISQKVVSTGDQWQYKLGLAALDSSWKDVATTETGWSSGVSTLGWGSSNLATVIDRGDKSPISVYFRKEISVNSLEEVKKFQISTVADDGVVVYLNGKEVGRKNISAQQPTFTTYANTAPSQSSATAAPLVIDVSPNQLVEGSNVIAVETHANWRNSPISFDTQIALDREVRNPQ
ncbi:fibrinogen [Rothia amarae]|uniref:Fibrinogen n=1 Tax=Rothia amarae TaxID=169480 RepID=A0A7H2BID5_9MICC|nr:fibrinogen-like YCDxxxxGGGW domain-containing protein [Rothia amarae]QNV39431.1 fibrinogen [Rothia amarae]